MCEHRRNRFSKHAGIKRRKKKSLNGTISSFRSRNFDNKKIHYVQDQHLSIPTTYLCRDGPVISLFIFWAKQIDNIGTHSVRDITKIYFFFWNIFLHYTDWICMMMFFCVVIKKIYLNGMYPSSKSKQEIIEPCVLFKQ